MELVSVILVVSKDVGQMVRQTSVSTNSIREGMLRLSQGSIPCCLVTGVFDVVATDKQTQRSLAEIHKGQHKS